LRVGGREDIERLKVRVVSFEVGVNRIELISPSSDDHELTHHLKNHGEGLHHIAFKVKDINETLKELKNMGIGLAPDKPQGKGHGGKEIAFLNQEDTCGILIEICEEKK
jgi:methylmalonyl-CoA/ethylmalonyl-CoA epimerase